MVNPAKYDSTFDRLQSTNNAIKVIQSVAARNPSTWLPKKTDSEKDSVMLIRKITNNKRITIVAFVIKSATN